ncbi:hypothetical protein HPB48_020885 [Haemaphysalis longicornis]|uniref:Uncharacterized protein n=1 Tax=Haemaphysalis longicornis TaxID=44386 RepID=A0A9J6FWI7_HAELO|nr:hypothetical protein HPB48_020885 [Haemaphysalis longicornis]
MDCASWIGADKEPSVVSGYLPTTIELTPRRGTIRTATTGLDAVDGESKTGCPVGDIAAPEPGVVRVIADFVGVAYATLASCLRSCGASALVTSGGDAVNSTACGQRKHRLHPQQEQRHKQRESVRRARDPARFGDAEDGRCGGCVVASLPALCAGVVAVLCYLNSLDGEFVHDDMVAVVGNPDVTGEHHRPRMQRSPSPLWVNDFWGRPMADPQSHKSYRPLTVFSFSHCFTIFSDDIKLPHQLSWHPAIEKVFSKKMKISNSNFVAELTLRAVAPLATHEHVSFYASPKLPPNPEGSAGEPDLDGRGPKRHLRRWSAQSASDRLSVVAYAWLPVFVAHIYRFTAPSLVGSCNEDDVCPMGDETTSTDRNDQRKYSGPVHSRADATK